MFSHHNYSYLFEAQKNILNIIFKLLQTSNFKMQQVQAHHSTYKLQKLMQPKFLHPSHWGGGGGRKKQKQTKLWREKTTNKNQTQTNQTEKKNWLKKNKKKKRQTGQKHTN